MASEFLDRAVDVVADLLDATLAAKLRLVEIASSIAPDSLTDPIRITRGQTPFNNESPLIQVYDEDWEAINQRCNKWDIQVNVVVTYSAAPDLVVGRLFMRRYMAAVKRVFRADPTGIINTDGVSAIIIGPGTSAAGLGDRSETRLIYAQTLNVHVHDGA